MSDIGISDVSDVSEAELSDGDTKPATKPPQPAAVSKPPLGAKASADSDWDSTEGGFTPRPQPARAPPLSARVSLARCDLWCLHIYCFHRAIHDMNVGFIKFNKAQV